MMKKYKVLFLFIAVLFLFSSCNVGDFPHAERDSMAGISPTESSTESTKPEDIVDVWDPPVFHTVDENEYKTFSQSKDVPFSIFSLDLFECFGTFKRFITYSGVTSRSEFDLTYTYQDEQIVTQVRAYSKDTYLNASTAHYGEIYIENADMPENLSMDPTLYWLRISENELVETAYYQKYDIDSDDKYIHFKINDNIILRYRLASVEDSLTVIFLYEDHVMMLDFDVGEAMKNPFELTCTNPTVKSLLTKSTSQDAAEELYNLWKDALK